MPWGRHVSANHRIVAGFSCQWNAACHGPADSRPRRSGHHQRHGTAKALSGGGSLCSSRPQCPPWPRVRTNSSETREHKTQADLPHAPRTHPRTPMPPPTRPPQTKARKHPLKEPSAPKPTWESMLAVLDLSGPIHCDRRCYGCDTISFRRPLGYEILPKEEERV